MICTVAANHSASDVPYDEQRYAIKQLIKAVDSGLLPSDATIDMIYQQSLSSSYFISTPMNDSISKVLSSRNHRCCAAPTIQHCIRCQSSLQTEERINSRPIFYPLFGPGERGTLYVKRCRSVGHLQEQPHSSVCVTSPLTTCCPPYLVNYLYPPVRRSCRLVYHLDGYECDDTYGCPEGHKFPYSRDLNHSLWFAPTKDTVVSCDIIKLQEGCLQLMQSGFEPCSRLQNYMSGCKYMRAPNPLCPHTSLFQCNTLFF